MPKSTVYNIDALQYMRNLPDNAFSLCTADPPYGLGEYLTQNGQTIKQLSLF